MAPKPPLHPPRLLRFLHSEVLSQTHESKNVYNEILGPERELSFLEPGLSERGPSEAGSSRKERKSLIKSEFKGTIEIKMSLYSVV